MFSLACVCYLVDLVSIIKNETNPKRAEIPMISPAAISISKLTMLTKGLNTYYKKLFKKKLTHLINPEFNSVTINGFCIGKKYCENLKQLNMRTGVY
jgi:hypothetical protein